LSRARRLGAAVGLLVLLLFAGRWAAGVLADRWWAAELSPAGAAFVTQSYLLRFVLKLAGVLMASAWFIGHLFAVYRAVGSVQIRRRVANIEIREALTPNTLLTAAIVGGLLLGVVVGGGASNWWREVVLAWTGVTYGIADPMLERDLGLYIAQLPLWRAAHGFFFLLVVLALGLVFGLYIAVGAVRWFEGRPAISDHARRHLGWLLLAFGGALAWGYLLEPYELVAGLAELPPPGGWRTAVSVAPVLAGVALAAGTLSAVWAVQPRHTLAAAGWLVLGVSSLIGHWFLPAMLERGVNGAAAESRWTERLTRRAYAIEAVQVERIRAADSIPMPAVPALWDAPTVSHLSGGDSASLFWADPALLRVQETPRPVWLVLQPMGSDGRLAVTALADDRAGPAGDPLFYHLGDTAPQPSPAALIELPAGAARPDARRYRIGAGKDAGVPVEGWAKRLVLTWALQVGALLGTLPPDARVDWHRSPSIRLARLAPFADWGAPAMRIIDGALVWVVDGYVTSRSFPLAHRTRWRGRTVGAVQAGFVGVVDAETGATRVYLRPGASPLTRAWAEVSAGLVEPEASLPPALLQALPYPTELFRVQAQEFERSPWRAGALAGRPAPGAPAGELPRTEVQWGPDGTGPVQVAVYDNQPGGRTVAGVLVGRRERGQDVLRLFRLDSTAVLPSRGVLETRWARFPSYDLLSDSVQDDGGRLERGPVRYEPAHGGLVAYQAHIARRQSGRAALVWVSVAAPGDRLGAGRSLEQAWDNLLGATVPAPPGTSQRDRLAEARSWVLRADSAVRSADWAAFGQAWRELRRALGVPTDSAGRPGAGPDSAP
jgi:hypothetical protein